MKINTQKHPDMICQLPVHLALS